MPTVQAADAAPLEAAVGERRTIYLFLILRMIVAALVVGAGIMIIQVTNASFPVRGLYLLLAVSVVTGAVFYGALKAGMNERVALWAVIVVDTLLETAIIHYSGGMSSQFSMIFCLTVVAAAFLLEVPGGLGAAILSSTCFVVYGIGETVGLISPPNRELLDLPLRAPGLLEMYMHISLFFLVGTVGGYLAHRIKQKGQALESAETELQQLKVDTDYILNNMSSGIVVIDSDGEVITINPAAEEILGVKCVDALAQHVGGALAQSAPELARELIDALSAETSRFRHEITVLGPTGRRTPLGTSISLMRDVDGDKRGVISVFQDLTEVQEMRERVRKADRLAAIGELSAAIAHELRNPLASISGSIEMLSGELDLSDENHHLMELVMRESDRLDRIISDFLEFARLRHPSKRPVAIEACIEEVLVLLRNAHGANRFSIRLDAAPELPQIRIDDEQMRQVFFNLAINACQAMEDGGALEIVADADGSEQVRIAFRDRGPGIDMNEATRLFEPFFTTKEGGTGLGLAIANKIVTAHDGTIAFRNREGGGAEFLITLPVGRIYGTTVHSETDETLAASVS